MKPTIFIGSTSEGKDFAKVVAQGLREVGTCKPWYDGVFEIAGTTQNSLVTSIREADFVVIVLTADDKTDSRDHSFFSPRDNLIFEAGIGFGVINPDRTFLIPEKIDGLKVPTDLLGFTLTAGFDRKGIPKESIAAAIDQIEDRIINMGCKSIYKMAAGKETLMASSIQLIQSADRHIMLFGRDLSWAEAYSEAIKERVDGGVSVEVFSENPKTLHAKESAELLESVGAKVYHLGRDPGVKFTMIDHQTLEVARFMIAFKERNAMGAKEPYSYHCEIHDAKESKVMWNTFTRFYESAMRELGEE